MEKERFVAAETESWWLLDRDVDHLIDNLRVDLGASFGWTDPTWYHERAKLEEVYDFIQQHRTELFYELEQATDDERRQRWLGSVVELKRPTESASGEPARSAATTVTPKTSAQPARRSAFASKSQPETQSPAADTGTAAPTAASTTAQPARKSAFASKSQPETQSPAADTGTAAPTAASTTAQPARKSAFATKSQPETQSPAADTAAQTTASTVDATPAEEQVGQIAEQIKEVMSELSPDDLSAIATDLGLSPEEVEAMVREPDFARLVAEEQA